MQSNEIHGNSVLILGYGREGKSIHAWLQKYHPSLRVGIADKYVKTELMSGETYKGATVYNGEGYLFHLSEYDTVIRSPGVSPYMPEISDFLKKGGVMTSATNIFFSLVSGTTIGVTGTKGKSTTSSLIAHILSSHFDDVRLAGNIGIPMLDSLDTATDRTIFVLELSSHQLYDCRYSPHIAVVLGIVSEHLDYYPDLISYAKAKSNITNRQTAKDFLLYNPMHTVVRELVRSSPAAHVLYQAQEDEKIHTFLRNGEIMVKDNDKAIPVIKMADVPLLGNEENILAAVTAAHLMRVPVETIARAITPFKSLPHRLEFVGEYRKIRFYNDSLATIPQATIHALEALGSDVTTLIVGGYDRGIDYRELGAYLRGHPVSTLILLPDTGEKIWEAVGMPLSEAKVSSIMKPYRVDSMEEALRVGFAHTQKGKICLLSPGSASYNMFRDYADRGEQFASWVRRIGSGA